MTAATDPTYTAARSVLLDALNALADHRDAVVLVGAQAVYLHAGDAELDDAVAPFTTDADLAVVPRLLGPEPEIADAMDRAGFTLKIKQGGGGVEPGSWLTSVTLDGGGELIVPVDLIVPETLAAGHGRRDARLPGHGNHATRWAAGLEAAVIDNTMMTISSLQPETDPRVTKVRVAGPAALLIAKCHKLGERVATPETRTHRIKPKDAGDIIRLMRIPMSATEIGTRLANLTLDDTAADSIRTGITHLENLFGRARSPGTNLAVRALVGAINEAQLRALAPAYVTELLTAFTNRNQSDWPRS
jgi:hypothetical protein